MENSNYTAEIYPTTEQLTGIPYAAGDIVDFSVESTGKHFRGVVWNAGLGFLVQPLFERLPTSEKLSSHSLVSLGWLEELGDVVVVGTYQGDFTLNGKDKQWCFGKQEALQEAYIDAQIKRLGA